MDRRDFIKTAGLGAFGLGGAAVGTALIRATTTKPSREVVRAKRWAMGIDLRACAQHPGCRKCIDACHAAHNVPSIPEPRHEVKWLWKATYERTFPEQVHEYTTATTREQPVPVLCNHCANAPCARVCPTGATWKRADGIVMMDEHRCIGCRYCMAACPYGARSFNWQDPRPYLHTVTADYPTRAKGVVETCTFCAERLVAGLPPACVEACQAAGFGALLFGDPDEPGAEIGRALRARDALRRSPALGTAPQVFYLV
ncbi:MAG: 4Fe-4S dicluster domain-containing protein [Acidobacteria bacterium]|nr:4Fe-4S dicluster domain-containing protein [Acidobacteriota bacterium]